MKLLQALAVLALSLALAACAGGRAARVDAALASDQVPTDFTIAAAVLRPVPLASLVGVRSAGPALTLSERPARYIIEADAILRAAVGAGANETTFPARTRQLSHDEWAEVWNAFRASPLAAPDHPAAAGRAPTIEEAAELSGNKTTWVVSYSVAGERETLVIHQGGEGEDAARKLVEQLAGLAWMTR